VVQNDVIVHIVEQHAEETAFLWTQRDRAVLSRNYKLKDLARLDERVEAHLDGLRIAGNAGWNICKQTVEAEETGAIFALAGLAFESSDPQKIKEVLALGCAKPSLERQLISALGWLQFERAKPILSDLVNDRDSNVRRIGIAGFAVHRKDPGPALIEAIGDPDHRLRARAIEAVAELGRRDLAGYIKPPATESDEDCCFAAAWSLARFGWGGEALRPFVENGGIYARRALEMAMRSMPLEDAKAWRSKLTRRSDLRFAVIGAGAIGDPALVEDLIVLMRNPKLAQLAGEAFALITGADFRLENLEGHPPAALTEHPSDDAESEDVSLDPDENLIWPDPDRIEAWWKAGAAKFQSAHRYLKGREITAGFLPTVHAYEKLSDRAAAALELAIQQPNRPIYETRQRGDFQLIQGLELTG
jgi:uncharacterized protein (TIGR02270 family)